MSESAFENRLLLELRALVADAPAGRRADARRPRRVRPRVAVVAGAVAAVAAVAGIPLLSHGTPAAYAVTQNDDGSVTVEIVSLKDAAGLERKLREAGIPTVVRNLPPGKGCAPPWPSTSVPPRGEGELNLQTMGAESRDGHVRFTIDGNTPVNSTLVIATQVGAAVGPTPPGDGEASTVAITWVQGDVPECRVVDAPAGAGPFGETPPPSWMGILRTS